GGRVRSAANGPALEDAHYTPSYSGGWQAQQRSGWPCARGRPSHGKPFRRDRINLQRSWLSCDVPACTRPPPVDPTLDKPPPNGVLVDLIDHFQQRRGLLDVPVVAAAFLPEVAPY